MRAIYQDGWIRVPYSGPELGVIEIGLGEDFPAWKPAFLQTVGTDRFAQVRPPDSALTEQPRVWLRINGASTLIGRLVNQDADARPRRRR